MSRSCLFHKLWTTQTIFSDAKLAVQSGVFRITHFHTLSRQAAICHNGGQKRVQSARKVEEKHNVNVIMYLNLHSICN